jgi:hypothetical protein
MDIFCSANDLDGAPVCIPLTFISCSVDLVESLQGQTILLPLVSKPLLEEFVM